ncbi:MAG: pseudouridine synthase [Patescibacteria group bacterium]
MQTTIKLQSFLAHSGVSSRRGAEKLIEEALVTVNDQPAHIGQRISVQKDKIRYRGKLISVSSVLSYYIIHKPVGFVSTTSDELERKTVLELLPEELRTGLYPVGRLDQDSEGLLLLTNDGDLTYILTHPKFEIEKTYQVLLQGIPSTRALDHLKRGVKLKDEYVKPVKITIMKHENKNTWLEIVISEGKKHQVKRMVNRIGYEVLRLIRVKMGPLELGELKKGEFRVLTDEELEKLLLLKKKS